MEPNDARLTSSYFHHHHHHQQQSQPPPLQPQPHPHPHNQTPVAVSAASPSNGLLSPSEVQPLGYHHSVPSAVTSPPETVRRKRGRPRKYGTSEQALSAKKASSSSPVSKKKEQGLASSSKSSQLLSLGSTGQGFTPHVINVATGEDVAQKIMFFMQQTKREICILSASGSISNASLRQPATSGGNVSIEGRYEILSLSGSYIRTEAGGRTGGLSVCLCNTNGEIVGGGVGGPLKAAGPVQVIVGSFMLEPKKDTDTGLKVDDSPKFSSPVIAGGSVSSNMGFRSAVESSGRMPVMGGDDHQGIGGGHFMIQSRGGMPMPTVRTGDWRSGMNAGYDLTGRGGGGRGACQSPENGGYDQIPD